MSSAPLDAYQKARTINRDGSWYGTIAEIGAGQETARWFFHVGGAAGSVAQSISAYDMQVSDAIYGKSQRYVSRQRLQQMMDREYQLLTERLGEKRAGKRLFAFANTVTARSHIHNDDGQGWAGVKFQLTPDDAPSEIQLHVRLLDTDNEQQQLALGLVGLNLIYGAYALTNDPLKLITSLMDRLSPRRVEVDMIRFTGPVAEGVDNRLMSLELVSQGLARAAMFNKDGDSVELAEALYHKPVLILPGTFRPVTRLIVAMLEQAKRRFVEQLGDGGKEPVVITGMNLHRMDLHELADQKDLLARMTMLQELGQHVFISNHRENYRAMEFLRRYTTEPTVLTTGVPILEAVFDPSSYDDLDGGVLEAVGRTFAKNVQVYVHPHMESGRLVTLDSFKPTPPIEHLYRYLRETDAIVPLDPDHDEDLSVFPDDVRKMICDGKSEWEKFVPESVAAAIKRHGLFGHGSSKQAAGSRG